MKFIPGLVSITFRELTSREIIRISKESGLHAIEWGGDIHVPAGDTITAQKVRELSEKEGLLIPEYGSYYTISVSKPEEIEGVIACSRTLGTRVVRVWAGDRSLPECSEEEYRKAVTDAVRICDLAPDLSFCLECHNHTLTQEYHDALTFLHDVNRENFGMFWQPNQFRSFEYNKEALKALLPYIKSVHVFSWEGDGQDTVFYPLSYHKNRWQEYLSALENSRETSMPLMLEFMHDGKPESLAETSEELLSWL